VTSAVPGAAILSLWCAATLGHFVLTATWVRRYGLSDQDRDSRFFVTMLTGVASLGAALHTVAVTAGLSLGLVSGVLALGHALAWRLAPRDAGEPAGAAGGAARALEAAAIVSLVAVSLRWVLIAVPTLEVGGTDAAHYHIPNAVNLALGASPFDLPPTSHLYPMGTSTLAAWFILPVGDGLLTDVPMLIAFLLVTASLCRLFRLTTGLSGLAWATWPVLALFGTPLFRTASLMSADLMFAGSVAALAAVLFDIILTRRLSTTSLLLTAAAAGLLVGVKTTGLVALVLLGGPAAVVFAVLLARGMASFDGPTMPKVALALLVAIAAGGIWLVRNWWVWGSPVVPNGLAVFGVEIFRGVPFERTTYLSVLGDLTADPAYPLGSRFLRYVGEWLGSWYLAALLPALFVPLDLVVCRLRGAPLAPVLRRVAMLVAVAGTMAPMLWLLAGAPWTSLEWTRGWALRYAQPWWALLPIAAFAGLFPVSLPWYGRSAIALVTGSVFALVGLFVLAGGSGPPFPPPPTMVTAAVAAGMWLWLFGSPARTRPSKITAVVLGLSIVFGVWTSEADVRARAEAVASGPSPTPVQRVYDAALAWEAAQGRTCGRRRFFVTTRLDEPLGLQGVGFTNFVFYAARDVAVTAGVEPLGRCDYVVSSRDVLTTKKGVELVTALNPYGATVEIAEVAPFVLLGTR